ncbi:MAG: CHAT domain-containing protein [Acidobacteriia bacterium]|nr:CHAT domain-containing protein [Terriglobia bacterium]
MKKFLRTARLLGGVAVALSYLSALTPQIFAVGRSIENLQDVKAPSTLEEELNAADRLVAEGKGEAARKLYEAAAARAHNEKNGVLESRALASIGRLLSRATKYVEAQKYLIQALPLAEDAGDPAAVARVCNSLGIAARYMGKADEARTWYKKAAEAAGRAGDLRLQTDSLINLAGLMDWSDPDAERMIRDAIGVADKIGARDLEARAFHRWGDFLFTGGDFAAAMEKLERAAVLLGEFRDDEELARVYTSMGRLNRAHGRPAEAIPLYEKALHLQQEVSDKVGVIQSLNAIGVAYQSQDDHKRAREYFERAYELALKTDSPRIIDFMRANLAGNLIDLQEYARAAPLLEEVLRRGADSNLAYRHAQLSAAYEGMGHLTTARVEADKAVELASARVDYLPAAISQRAEVRELQGDLPGAMEDALEVIRVTEGIRERLVPLDFMKQGFSSYYQLGYSFLVGLYHRLGKPEKALEVAELARARAFLDLLATKEVRLKATDESKVAALRLVQKELKAQGIDPVEASSDLTNKSNPAKRAGEADSLLQQWKSASPELQSFVAGTPQTAAEIIATAAHLQSTIISYWAGKDALYIWVVKPDGHVSSRRVEVTERRLTELVNAASAVGSSNRQGSSPIVRRSAQIVSAVASKEDWRELYNLLILPLRQWLPSRGHRLTIIPHGPLMRLSFAALTDEKGRYLLEEYPLHYAPAAALLEFLAARRHEKDGVPHFLLVADPAFPPALKSEDRLSPLPGARAEVRGIAHLLPAEAVTMLLGPQANKQAVTDWMSRSSVIHFATHGVGQDYQPLDSYLALSGGNEVADARLSAREVYALDLHADLVVLSSCRSGGGKLTGEGIAALARAFFYAGAPSLIVSLWDVPDQPANRLLPGFYASWLHGRDKIDALRAAQLHLLGDLRAGRVKVRTPAGEFVLSEHPSLWAGFVLLGEP